MAALNGFNAKEVEPNTGFDAIPAGKYEALIVDSEMRPTKSGSGEYLYLTFQITEGDFKNRKLWTRLNLNNPNEMAVKIARGELSAICRAVDVLTPDDSTQLHNIPLVIKVVCKKNVDTDEITNEIKGYYPAGKTEPAKPAANGTSSKMGWMAGKK